MPHPHPITPTATGRRLGLLLILLTLLGGNLCSAEQVYDVVIYGGTSGGVAAAVQAQRMGKSAVIIEPGQHLGGMTSGGLGATDIGNKAAIGGVSREFYQRVKKYYQDPPAWKFQRREDYRSRRQRPSDDAMWTFEPHVAEKILREMTKQAGAAVVYGERLDRQQGVTKEGPRIVSLTMESGRKFAGRRFIDATYEGDLLAAAGVSFHVGREANSVYDETLNGVQTKNAVHHQMMPGVDPYVTPNDPSSGLLPGVHSGPPGAEGSGDARVQAYNFRMCLTDVPENQRPFARPPGYDPLDYELLLRNFEAGETRTPWAPTMMPNRKTDTNNNHGFSTDFINENYNWPEGSYEAREKIFLRHLRYQQGLMWTLANHPRVPEKIRNEVSRWGTCKDEFPEHDGWPHQLYVREGRRMISDYVMTQHNCQGRVVAEDSVALAAYTMDSHNVQRYVDENGHARNEGDVQVGGFPPYPISYRSIVPKRSQCANLLTPVCLSASHIAYGSIRMEPVFMVLGQSAATAACLSLDDDVDVQQLQYDRLAKRLKTDGQVLVWTGPRPPVGKDPRRLDGVVMDDAEMKRSGTWASSASVGGFVGSRYWHDNDQQQGQSTATFSHDLDKPGEYEARLAYTAASNRAGNVPVTIHHAQGTTTVHVDQRKSPDIDGTFISLGRFHFGKQASVVVSNEGADGHVIADAVQLIPSSK